MKCRMSAIGVALSAGLGATFLVVWALVGRETSVLAAPNILYVAPGAQCGVANPCFGTVQGAVDNAMENDEIRVAGGTYTGVIARNGLTQVVYLSKTLIIRGGYTPADWNTFNPLANPTTLDAQRAGRVIYITGEANPTIEGLRITKGDATSLAGGPAGKFGAGGGVYISQASAIISDSVVYDNIAVSGGGVYLVNSASTVQSNTVISNSATQGGGLYLDKPVDAAVNGNAIFSNTASSLGGGLYIEFSTRTRLTNNTVSHNSADDGGGLRLNTSPALLQGNAFTFNRAENGGGLNLGNSHAKLINNLIADNEAVVFGGGMYVADSSPVLLHTTLVGNSGASGDGLYVTKIKAASAVALTNTILVSHTQGIRVTRDNALSALGVLWYGTPITISAERDADVQVGQQIAGDPAFAADGYHLTVDSAAINKGVDAGVVIDIDGDVRPDGCYSDLGVDEYMSGIVCHVIYLPWTQRQAQ